MTVYVVISNSVIHGHQSNGLHGVYATKSAAQSTAISAIKSIAKRYYHDVNMAGIDIEDGLEFSYQNDNIDIFVSCIEQEVH